jgi:16S rRNA G966 N2-methylase RsmD/Zn ribbon nucleic-acid-binding protein
LRNLRGCHVEPRASAGIRRGRWDDPAVSAAQQLMVDGLDHQEDVLASRSDSVYRVHAYHTKVPPSVAARYILRHTEPGDLVLDPFCGSGMTGVAAALSGRRAFLGDLSPAAVHIAANYTTPCPAAGFREGVERVLTAVGERIAAAYETVHDGLPATLEYLVWSDLRGCPGCGTEILLWEQRENGVRRLRCPSCGHEEAKSGFPVVGERAVEANLSTPRGRVVREAIEADLGGPPATDLPWFPTTPFGRERPMWRRGHEELGIRTVADFYSRRNLAALALLWDAAGKEPDARVRSALRFSLTAIANRASRRYQWNAKRPTNVLGGTLYVSSLRYEWNVLSLWRRKAAAVERFFRDNPMPAGSVEVHEGSATALPLGDESVDYCFTDPPFGAHIVYSDSSLLWEAWLDDLTDRDEEAIVVSGGDRPKSVDAYAGLLRGSFAEIHRVLKPEGRATVIFQATDPVVWRAIQLAAVEADLRLADAASLDKGQPSFKQIKGRGGERVAQADIILTFERGSPSGNGGAVGVKPLSAAEALRATLERAGGDAIPAVGKLYATVNARLLSSGAVEILNYDALLALLREERGGVELPSGQGSRQ